MRFYFFGKPQPHSVFYNYIVLEKQLPSIIANPDYSVIDVCCFFPQYLFHIYSMIGKKYFVGLEGYSEREVTYAALKNLLRLKREEVTYKIHNIFASFSNLTNPNYFSQFPILSEEEFIKVFDLRFSIDVNNEVKKLGKKFDYLILNNVIHLPAVAEEHLLDKPFLDDCLNLLKPKGLLYVKVNHQDNPSIKEINQVRFTEGTFKALFADYFDEIYFHLENNKNNVKQTMVYFGKLKINVKQS